MKLLTCAEAAKLLDVTPAGVRAIESRGEIKAFRTETGVRLFKRGAVETLARMRARKRQPKQEPAQL
jgi:DNA-binding transcriptional MerR regulator